MRILSWLIFFLLVIIEGSVTTLPLTLIFLLFLTVVKRQEWIFLLAFVAGILLDVFAFHPLGISSFYFVVFIFLLLLYQRKYETATMPFIGIAAFFGSCAYLFVTGQSAVFLQAIISTIIAGSAFVIYRFTNRPSAADGFLHA